MKKFKGIKNCECGNQFEWNYIKLDVGECWFGKAKDKAKNCLTFSEIDFKYVLGLQCPYCLKKFFAEIDKH